MADCKLMALLKATGQSAGLPEDALANLAHVPLFHHFASVLTMDENYVSPEDAELADAYDKYESNPELAEQEVLQLIDLRVNNPDLFALELADQPELRELVEDIVKHDERIKEGDTRLSRTRSHLSVLQENSQSIRLQQQQAEQGLARQTRFVEARAAAAASRNAADNHTVQSVQECARIMQELLHKSGDRWLLLAHPLDELRDVEKAISAEIAKAKEQLCPGELARRLAEQQAAQGALPDTPFMASATRMLTGLEPEQYAAVLSEAEKLGTSGRLMRDRADRLQAGLAGLQRQVELLQRIADEAEGGGPGGGGLSGFLADLHDPDAPARLRDEVEALQCQIASLHDGEQRQALLDQLAAVFTAQVKRALWLLRHQQLGYMTQLQRQLLDTLLQQWARTEVVQMVRAEERRTLQNLYMRLGSVCSELEDVVRLSAADADDYRAVVATAESAGLVATDRGPQALLGGDGALCAASTLLDCQKQRLQIMQQMQMQQQQEAGSSGAETGVGPGGNGGGGAAGGGGGGSAFGCSSMPSPQTGSGGVGSGGGGGAAVGHHAYGTAPGGGNAFLDSLLSDPAHRTVSLLAAGLDGALGSMARCEGQLQLVVCGQLQRLAAEGATRVEEMRALLAGPLPPTASQSQQPDADAEGGLPPGSTTSAAAGVRSSGNSTIGGTITGSNALTVLGGRCGEHPHPQSHAHSAASGPTAGGIGGLGRAGAGVWPVLRDPSFAAELATTRDAVDRTLAEIQAFVSQQNMLLSEQQRQSEQRRLERGVLACFWNAPEQLMCDVQGLRDRLAALISSQ